jgi:hypothetical protein
MPSSPRNRLGAVYADHALFERPVALHHRDEAAEHDVERRVRLALGDQNIAHLGGSTLAVRRERLDLRRLKARECSGHVWRLSEPALAERVLGRWHHRRWPAHTKDSST